MHDVAKYSTWVVFSDVITIQKWRAAVILDHCTQLGLAGSQKQYIQVVEITITHE